MQSITITKRNDTYLVVASISGGPYITLPLDDAVIEAIEILESVAYREDTSTAAIQERKIEAKEQQLEEIRSIVEKVENNEIINQLPITSFSSWRVNFNYDESWVGRIVQWRGKLYRIIQPIHSMEHQSPSHEGMEAHYELIPNPVGEGEYENWYMRIVTGWPANIIVQHKGKLWLNTHGDANVWEPGAPGIDSRFWVEWTGEEEDLPAEDLEEPVDPEQPVDPDPEQPTDPDPEEPGDEEPTDPIDPEPEPEPQPDIPEPWEDKWTLYGQSYGVGDRVSHNGRIWVSTHETNTWEPGNDGGHAWRDEGPMPK